MADRIILACTVVLAGVYFWATAQIPTLELGDPLGPKAFPRMLGVGLLLGAVMLLVEIIRNSAKARLSADKGEVSDEPKWDKHHWLVVAIAVWTAVYIIAFEPLGFILSTASYLLALTVAFNRKRWLMNMLTSVLFAVISYFMFTKLLGVNLPPGILPF
ncbi:MAG: small permease component of tripartite tricarboxylate transporter [Pseudomonadota bacterium]|jgi:putative tricarboxylic transport membrane protein